MTTTTAPTAALQGGGITLRLPLLVAGRDLADRLLDLFDTSFTDRAVIVDAARTEQSSPSFSGRLVERLLVEERSTSLTLVGAPDGMVTVAREVAATAGVSDRLFDVAKLPRRPAGPTAATAATAATA